MARSLVGTVLSVGLSAATLAFCFLGCNSLFDDANTGTGKCEDDGNPCTTDTCTTGATVHTPAPDGDICSLGDNPGKCGKGRCVLDCETNPASCKCTSGTECPANEDCANWGCTNGQCTRTPANDGNMVGAQTDGDCLQQVCQGGNYATIADDMDPKPSDGCVTNGCSNGTPTTMNTQLGTACVGGACDGKGMCVACFSVTDWTTCGMGCPVKKCDGEVSGDGANCKSGNAADGVCCDTACTDECKSCNIMGKVGKCTDIPYYQVDPMYTPSSGGSSAICDPATAGAVCDGKGKCLKTVGSACLTGAQCISGTCSAIMTCLGAPGEVCFIGTDCVSGMCMVGKCK